MVSTLRVAKLGFVRFLFGRRRLRKLAMAGLLWGILPSRLKRFVIGWVALSLIVLAASVVLVALFVNGTI
jgi:hypothetical protein